MSSLVFLFVFVVFGCDEKFRAADPPSWVDPPTPPTKIHLDHQVWCIDFTRDQYPGTWPLMGATVHLAVGRQASVLNQFAPSRSRGISAVNHRRWAAYAMSVAMGVSQNYRRL